MIYNENSTEINRKVCIQCCSISWNLDTKKQKYLVYFNSLWQRRKQTHKTTMPRIIHSKCNWPWIHKIFKDHTHIRSCSLVLQSYRTDFCPCSSYCHIRSSWKIPILQLSSAPLCLLLPIVLENSWHQGRQLISISRHGLHNGLLRALVGLA